MYINKLKIFLTFYRKLILPSIFSAILISIAGGVIYGNYAFSSIGISYIIFGAFYHYIIYEMRNSNEYYFYYNLGFDKLKLWLLSAITNVFIGLLIILI